MKTRDYGIAHRFCSIEQVKQIAEDMKNSSEFLHEGYIVENVIEHLEELIKKTEEDAQILSDVRKQNMFEGVALAQTFIHWPRTFYDLGQGLWLEFAGKQISPQICKDMSTFSIKFMMKIMENTKDMLQPKETKP